MGCAIETTAGLVSGLMCLTCQLDLWVALRRARQEVVYLVLAIVCPTYFQRTVPGIIKPHRNMLSSTSMVNTSVHSLVVVYGTVVPTGNSRPRH